VFVNLAFMETIFLTELAITNKHFVNFLFVRLCYTINLLALLADIMTTQNMQKNSKELTLANMLQAV
jgi:hypothetical protein